MRRRDVVALLGSSLVSGVPDSGSGHLYINLKADKRTAKIDGFEVTTLSTRVVAPPAYVLITVAVGQNATLSFRFNGVSENDAMTIARKFDWKQIGAMFD